MKPRLQISLRLFITFMACGATVPPGNAHAAKLADVYFWRTHFRQDERIGIRETVRLDGWLYGQNVTGTLEIQSEDRLTKARQNRANFLETVQFAELRATARDRSVLRLQYPIASESHVTISDTGVSAFRRLESESTDDNVQAVIDLLRSFSAPDHPVSPGETWRAVLPCGAGRNAVSTSHVSGISASEAGQILTVACRISLPFKSERSASAAIAEGKWKVDPITGRILVSDFSVSGVPARTQQNADGQTIDMIYHADYTYKVVSVSTAR